MFDKIPRKTIPKFTRNSYSDFTSVKTSFFGQLYEDTMNKVVTTSYGRAPAFRPSSLPLCSILTYMKLVKGASLGYFEQEMSASGGYFTSVGTAAHENIQYYIGTSGKVWGDWSCITPGCKHANAARDLYDENGKIYRKGKSTAKNTVHNVCTLCKHPMRYDEKEIRYKGLVGHIDCIILMPNGRFWIADYKTSTKIKLMSGKLPHKGHLIQLPAYCYVLKKRYKMDVAGFSLLYLSRDNPFLFFEHSEEWTDKWDKRSGNALKREKIKYVAGVKSFVRKDHHSAVREKPCSSRKYYDDEVNYYEPCPMLSVCFNRAKLEKALHHHAAQYPYTKKDIDRLIPTLNMQEGDL